MGENSNERIAQVMNVIFRVVSVVLLTYFLLGELFLPAEGEISKAEVEIFETQWEMVLVNQKRVKVEVPGEYDVPEGEDFVLETILPITLEESIWLCFRSSQQDMEIYVDNELRQYYSTENSKPFGKTSANAFVFVEIGEEDAGKVLRMVTRSDSSYSGVVNEVYMGDRLNIWLLQWKEQGYKLVIAVVLIVLSAICIIISMVLRIGYRKKINLEYLGWGIIFAAVWVIAESRLRQFIFSNYSIAASMGFFAIMLLPLPFIIYINGLQKGRYQKWYMGMTIIIIINLFVCTGLQITNRVDFLESLFVMHIVLGIVFILGATTIFIDVKKRRIKEYVWVAVGMIGVLLAACVEIFLVYQKEQQISGFILCISMLCLLVIATYTTGKDIFRIEREKQRAVVSGEAKLLFLANMSHEIRTPINTIIGMNEVIMRENKDEAIEEYVDHIQRASKMLLALVNDVLDFSKIDTGKVEVEEYSYHSASMMNDLVHLLLMKAQQKKLEAKIYVDKNIPSILKGDEIRVKQIITNLLTNAVKYTEEGRVTFSVVGIWNQESEFCLEVSVSDTGKGIREEDLEKVFDRFARVDRKKNRNVEGTGLGLSITKLLVERMNGHIAVKSKYGEGSVFTVTIPQEVIQLDPIGDLYRTYRQQLQEEKRPKQSIYIPGAKILAVDDNEMNLTVVKALLKNTGISVDTVLSGKEALEVCRKKKYDLIFMDHMMPDLDGVETLHLLRAEIDNPNATTKVVVLTANALSGSKEKYLSEGFDDYFSKPIEVDKLEHVLMKYLGDKALSELERIEFRNNERISQEDKNKETELIEREDTIMNTPNEQTSQNGVAQIDQELGVRYCAGSREVYEEMLVIYLEQVEKYMTELPEFFEKRDWKNYAISVHSLKSTSLTIGAKEFSEKAKEQEIAAKEGQEEFLLSRWERFMEEYKCVIEAVKKIATNA